MRSASTCFPDSDPIQLLADEHDLCRDADRHVRDTHRHSRHLSARMEAWQEPLPGHRRPPHDVRLVQNAGFYFAKKLIPKSTKN